MSSLFVTASYLFMTVWWRYVLETSQRTQLQRKIWGPSYSFWVIEQIQQTNSVCILFNILPVYYLTFCLILSNILSVYWAIFCQYTEQYSARILGHFLSVYCSIFILSNILSAYNSVFCQYNEQYSVSTMSNILSVFFSTFFQYTDRIWLGNFVSQVLKANVRCNWWRWTWLHF